MDIWQIRSNYSGKKS